MAGDAKGTPASAANAEATPTAGNARATLTTSADDETRHGSSLTGEPDALRRHLLVFSGSSSSLVQLPPEGTLVIGRAETSDIQLAGGSISRQHARLVVERDRVAIVDLGSHNGTLVNGERVTGARALAPGDTIAIHTATLILHAAHRPAAPAVVEAAVFRQRVEDELDRAVRYERSFTLLVALWPEPVADRRPIEQVLERQLRRIDAAAWSTGGALQVLLAEASTAETEAFVARLRERLAHPGVRIGHAGCPADGADVDALLARAEAAAAGASLGETHGAGRAHEELAIGGQRVIVADPAVIRLYALIDRLAPTDLPILITGETGCGKELAATAVHIRSPRGDRPLVSLNCAAIQETLVESELFGYEKGAFTGAASAKLGLIEAAHGSTLFLDEIGELSPTTQAKLLRVLETQRFTRIGDVRERTVDVRVVAATHRDLRAEVAAGRFRQDLYFRLSGATLQLPPLRERPRELALLAAAFLDEACARGRRSAMRITEGALRALRAHDWPGNVRELRNLMKYLAAAHPGGELTAEHVLERLDPTAGDPAAGAAPDEDAAPASGPPPTFRPLAEEIRELEIARIRAALDATSGNLTRAAALLSIPIRTFSEKVKLHGLTPKKRGAPR